MKRTIRNENNNTNKIFGILIMVYIINGVTNAFIGIQMYLNFVNALNSWLRDGYDEVK